jgi:hypothetical protein
VLGARRLLGASHHHSMRVWTSAPAAGQALGKSSRQDEVSLAVRAQLEGMFSYF